jgi:predicted nuclease of predicted toxin-antitoxin system
MRFLADENVSRRVVESLVRDGHEVVEINRTNSGADDPTVLGVANNCGQILITEDRILVNS